MMIFMKLMVMMIMFFVKPPFSVAAALIIYSVPRFKFTESSIESSSLEHSRVCLMKRGGTTLLSTPVPISNQILRHEAIASGNVCVEATVKKRLACEKCTRGSDSGHWKEKRLEEEFEPIVLSEKYMTEKDDRIREVDVHGRIQACNNAMRALFLELGRTLLTLRTGQSPTGLLQCIFLQMEEMLLLLLI